MNMDDVKAMPLLDKIGQGSSNENGTRKSHAWESSLALVVLLIALTVGDTVIGTVLFDKFGEIYSQYLNQGTAFVYCIVSSSILLVRKFRTGRYGLEPEDNGSATGSAMAYAPWALLIVIGLLNGSGNFLMAVAQPHTAGLTQSLFSVCAGIPIVMLLSAIFLHKTPSSRAAAGASLIVMGAVISTLRTVFNKDGDSGSGGITTNWYSTVLFAG